jgi:hypothetical protein
MKKLALLLGLVGTALVLAAIGRASAPQASAITRSSTFDSNNEGWFFDNLTSVNPVNPATWHGLGGNPGGYITGHVIAGRAGFESNWSSNGGTWDPWNALGAYGGKIQVDMEASDPTAEAVIEFSTNNSNVEACQDTGGPFANGWHTYSITLDPSGLDDCKKTDTPLTVAQATAALAGFDGVYAYVFANDKQADFTVNLDNASLSGPQTAVTPPTGTVTRQFTLMHTGRKFQGTLTASDDYSCAGETKVTIFRKAKKPVKVGTATTSAPNTRKFGSAKFSFKLKRLVKGSYYASAGKAQSPLDGNTCNAAHSNSVRLR